MSLRGWYLPECKNSIGSFCNSLLLAAAFCTASETFDVSCSLLGLGAGFDELKSASSPRPKPRFLADMLFFYLKVRRQRTLFFLFCVTFHQRVLNML